MSRPQLPIPKATALWTNKVMVQDTATYASPEVVNLQGFSGVIFRVFADSEVGTATLDIKTQAYCEVEAVWYDIAGASFAQITANATVPVDLIIGPSLAAVSNRVVAQPVHRRMRLYATVGDATTEGFTVSAEAEFFNA